MSQFDCFRRVLARVAATWENRAVQLTRRKKMALMAVALLVVGAACLILWVASLPSIASHAAKIHVGMTYDDVLSIWGKPVQKLDYGDGWETAYWDPPDGRFIVHFRYGKVTHKSAHEMDPTEFFWWRLRRRFGLQ